MKITRRQLRRIIKEAIDVDTDGDGALDPDELRDLAGDLESRSKEAIVGAQSLRADGTSFEDFTTELLDYLEDKTGITWNEEQLPDDINYYDAWLSGENPSSIGAEYLQDASDLYRENKVKITRGQLRQIIKETLLTEKNENPSWNLYKYTGDVWTNLKTNVQGAAGESSKVADTIRDIYVSLSGIALQFAAANTPGGKISSQDIDRNINEINTRLNDLRKFSQASPEEIAALTGDEAFNVSKMKFATTADQITIDEPQLASTKDDGEE